MALLLSRVMASMVKTDTGTVVREVSCESQHRTPPKYHTLGNTFCQKSTALMWQRLKLEN